MDEYTSPDTRGYYQKYVVERVDGRPITGPTFTLELDHDPHAIPAMRAYIESLRNAGGYEELESDLQTLVAEYA